MNLSNTFCLNDENAPPRRSGVGEAAGSDAGGSLLFPQTWSPIIDISTWFPQLEHFIVGMKADCRDRSVMIVTVIPNPLVCVVLPNTHSFVVGCQSIKL